MNEKALNTLEFQKIRSLLSAHANSEEGKKQALSLVPSSDFSEIKAWQSETAAAVDRMRLHGNISFSGVRNLADSMKRLEIGASLSASELLSVGSLLEVAERVKKYGENTEGGQDVLSPYFQEISPLFQEAREIHRCILSEDEIADDASGGLLSVRRRLHSAADRVHAQLNSVLNSSRSMLQDAVITMRNGRYCLPVRAEYKSSFPGMVHDQSATGSTLFIEPLSVVRLNNEIRELEAEEKKEIEKVLAKLSESLAPHTTSILENVRILGHLDFVFAKAKLAGSMKAEEPLFNDDRVILIKEGRHPLIDRQKVVPVTIRLGDEFSMLVITGPNTGGKTVCLKTVGLFQIMGQSGLFIPAEYGSKLGVFHEIYADIGDEQSIEQSLSTFSAHMTNTVRILSGADSESLCLFDELGAGTDPTEGAALAMAILQFLHNMETRTVATTHYAEIKLYALTTEGVENASCEFDVETLSPTYRLLIGVPGKSNAFAISRKLGLPDYIIEDAKKRIDAEEVKFEDVITSLEESRATIEREREEIQRYREEISEYKKRARESSKGVEKGRDKILQNAREEAARILQDAKETADSIVKELRKQEKQGSDALTAEHTRALLNRKLKDTQAAMSIGQSKGPSRPVSRKKLSIGDRVHVLPLNLDASVSTLPDRDGKLYVTAGIIRTKVDIKDIEMIEQGKDGGSSSGAYKGAGISYREARRRGNDGPGSRNGSGGNLGMYKAMGISTEINLIGMTTAEAQPELSKYLDDAYLARLPEVRIVHGRGTGALKKMVHSQLKKNKYVESFRLGEFGEGSDGVTIAYFKK